MRSHGFTLIESLIALSFFSLIVLTALEFLGFTGRVYANLQKKVENSGAAAAAMDKIKADLREGGSGMTGLVRLGAVEGIGCSGEMLVIRSREESFSLAANTAPRDTRLILESTRGLKSGSEVCLFASGKADICRVTAVDGQALILLHPLENTYETDAVEILSMRRVAYFFDNRSRSIKRKVNDSPAQPLLDGVDIFECRIIKEKSLTSVKIRLENDKEKTYDLLYFSKNTAIAGIL